MMALGGSHAMNRLLRCVALLSIALLPNTGFAQDRFFDSSGVQIRYVEQGAGESIVFVHGRGGEIVTWVTSGVLENFTKDYHVIALDLRGHGRSGKPHAPKQYGREMGLDIIRLLDHLGVQQAHIVGYSLGANIAAQLLATHPDRFVTATLAASAGRFSWTAEDDKMFEQEASEIERDGVSRSAILRLAPPNEPQPTEAEIKRRSEAALANPSVDRHAIAAFLRSFREQVITPGEAAAVRVPTLGIVGSADPLHASLQELKKLRPALKLVVVEGATHSGERGIIRRPEFVTAIRELLAAGRQPVLR
jgi:pimeloyl-ACP methyl ester carboxylesterase